MNIPHPPNHMKFLKTLPSAALLGLAIAGSAFAAVDAGVIYSFESVAPRGTYTTDPVFAGFLSASAITRTGSGNQGGEASFIDFQGTTWTGSGDASTGGNSLAWTGGGDGTGSFSLTLNTTSLTNLNVRLAVRSAGTGATTTFASFTYNIGAGNVAIDTPLGFQVGPAGGKTYAFHEWTADLPSIGALTDQDSLTLTWAFAGNVTNTSVRIDNIQITAVAIPEPSTYAMLIGAAALGGVLIRRRHATKN